MYRLFFFCWVFRKGAVNLLDSFFANGFCQLELAKE
jgi:hypothetical protein